MLAWPIREGILAYRAILKKDTLEDFRYEVLAYRIAGGKERPKLPAILRD